MTDYPDIYEKAQTLQYYFDRLAWIENRIKNEHYIQLLSIILFPLIIGVFIRKNSQKQSAVLITEKEEIIKDIQITVNNFETLSKNMIESIKLRDTYLIYPDKSRFIESLKSMLKVLSFITQNPQLFSRDFIQNVIVVGNQINETRKEIESYNSKFVSERIKKYQYLFDKSPQPLDLDQKTAVVTDDLHNIVVAGAGSGKTEVLINRIAYLIERKPDTINPDRILALAYQNKAAKEITDRLKSRFGYDVKIKTFHSFGKEIYEEELIQSNQNLPNLMFSGDNFDSEYRKYISSLYIQFQSSTEFPPLILDFIKNFGDSAITQTESDFSKKEDYYQYLKKLSYKALDGTNVKSEAEREILNFLLTHSINGQQIQVLYESPAKWMKYKDGSGREKVPKPDFFLPDYELYIEHWAIDQNNQVPPWFNSEGSSTDYIQGMKAKKERFSKQNVYSLLETTHAEYARNPNGFSQLLQKKLLNHFAKHFPDRPVIIEPLSYEQIVTKVWLDCRESVKSLPKHIASYIQIAKTYGLSPGTIVGRYNDGKWSKKQIAFANIAIAIFNMYQKRLTETNSIDFTDMINIAVKRLQNNPALFKDRFDHILIDEYQDISYQRFQLIFNLMQKNNNCKLFCVGDDWQSIMGFAGSNLDFFVNFENYFTQPARTELKMNYRSNKSIVETGAAIIRYNGDKQLKKNTIAHNQNENIIRLYSFPCTPEYKWNYYEQMAKHTVDLVDSYLKTGYNPEEILILARIFNRAAVLNGILDYAKQKGVPISTESNKRNHVHFMSVHRSKGLEAKLVIILNVDQDLYGFPCEIDNPDIYATAIIGRENDREEEERRLFYVAITRAKEEVILYTCKNCMSKFLGEIKNHLTVQEI